MNLPPGWSEDDHVVICQPWAYRGHSLASKAQCELCGMDLCAFPASIERCKKPNWHLICTPNCAGKLAAGGKMKFSGRVRANQFIDRPTELKP